MKSVKCNIYLFINIIRRNFISKNNFPKTNREIRAKEVRLVGENGEMHGVVNIREALDMAERAGLDLVEISPNAVPPVCKILDFGKFKYESKKRLHEARKKQKIVVLKEMKFKPNISIGDFETKLKKIKEFLKDGDKVKISLWFKGREILHKEVGQALFKRIEIGLAGLVKIDQHAKMEGKQMIMIVSPDIKVQ
ncbi:Translation initiation factor IF-3 [Rickettsia massiliae MTU5]|uniref:Translation initiation factor IF-3 n=1 Tax=Rickettsia massiliae (strain Mtu5) TaxID=416276 RepID=A8F1R9_RICM5|nr:Translation initiation factor IF-3 [Rickettsia massiliae MTU5]